MRLKLIYALHMVLPMALMLWHIERLSDETAKGLLRLFAA